MSLHRILCLTAMSFALSLTALAEMKTENFDHDPKWEGFQNRPDPATRREVKQDFGYSPTEHCGKGKGEIGGTIQPDGVPAYYAKALDLLDYTKPFSASGIIHVPKGPGNTFLGFFNHETINEWRTPNAIGFRINQRGDVFHMHTEFATSKWRAGAGVFGRFDAQADRIYPIETPCDTTHTFTLAYTPAAGGKPALIHATFDDVVADTEVAEEYLQDGATFDHFGFLNIVKSVDSAGELWISGLTINGKAEDLTRDPHWDELNNRRSYLSEEVRPRFNFGYAASHFAGGAAPGEIGGLFYRGDCREPLKLASYGDEIGPLTLNDPLHVSGKITFRKGVSDSTTLFGFYHARHSLEVNPSQKHGLPRDFFGIAVEGPSREGFYLYPTVRGDGDEADGSPYAAAPRIYPDATTHSFSFDYDPAANGGVGEVRVTLDTFEMKWPLPKTVRDTGAAFDRLGFVTPWIDGNGQVLFFDDLRYTASK